MINVTLTPPQAKLVVSGLRKLRCRSGQKARRAEAILTDESLDEISRATFQLRRVQNNAKLAAINELLEIIEPLIIEE